MEAGCDEYDGAAGEGDDEGVGIGSCGEKGAGRACGSVQGWALDTGQCCCMHGVGTCCILSQAGYCSKVPCSAALARSDSALCSAAVGAAAAIGHREPNTSCTRNIAVASMESEGCI